MNDPTPLTPPAAFKDRHASLIVFGIIVMVMGAICALFAPLAIVGQIMTAKRAGVPFDAAAAIFGCGMFTAMAATLIWLGIGSALARRWARALLVCLSWMGLCAGIFAVVVVALFGMSSLNENLRNQGTELPPAAIAMVKVVTCAFIAVIYIGIPGALAFFYSRASVKLTCEARDPVERWTDRCPLPVLAFCVMLAGGVLAMLALCVTRFGNSMPMAGVVLHGFGARLFWVAYALFTLCAVRGFYRLRLRMWRIYMIISIIFWVSSIVTIARIGMAPYLQNAGLTEAQIGQLGRNPLTQFALLWMNGLCMLIFVGFLLYIRRYFKTPVDSPISASP